MSGRAEDRSACWNWVLVSNLRAKRGSRRGVVDDGGLAGLGHPARDAFADLHAEARRRPCPSRPGPARRSAPCFSSSTISIDQASEGMSCWILAMISSMTLRGSRIGVGGLHDVGEDGQPLGGRRRSWRRPPGADSARHRRAASSDAPAPPARGGVARAPRAEVEVEAERRERSRVARVARTRTAAHRPRRRSARAAVPARGPPSASQLHQRAREARTRGAEARAGREERRSQARPRPRSVAPQRPARRRPPRAPSQPFSNADHHGPPHARCTPPLMPVAHG